MICSHRISLFYHFLTTFSQKEKDGIAVPSKNFRLFYLRFQIGIDEFINVAVHDRVDVSVLVIRPVILHQSVRHKDVGADLRTPLDGLLFAIDIVDLRFLLFDLQLIELAL